MSFEYYVAIPKARWPTAAAVQAALDRLQFPVVLGEVHDGPFSVPGRTFRLPVIFEGYPVVLEANTEQATDIDDEESLFGYLAKCAADKFTITNGDFFLTLTFRSDSEQVRAGLYLLAAMILSFDGYGFENQFESHGSADWARQLIAEASDASAWEV